MDITTLIPKDEAVDCEIFHPVTGESTGIIIKLLGSDSKEWKQAARAIKARALKQGKKKLSDDEIEQMPFELLAAVTIGWEGVEENGKKVKFTKEEAKRIYESVPVIAEQVDKFVGDRENFLPKA